MTVRVGFLRALLYYYYYPFWRTFLTELGTEVVLSSPTTKNILEEGLKRASEEICLPVKVAYGHLIDLAGKADCVLLPRIVSVEKKEYICPKFLGLPDMVKQVEGLPELICVDINFYRGKRQILEVAGRVGCALGANRFAVLRALGKALSVHKRYFRLLSLGLLPEEAMAVLEDRVEKVSPVAGSTAVAVIGHPYNIYDGRVGLGIVGHLTSMGVKVFTPENVPAAVARRYAASLPKKLFWTLGQQMIGAALCYAEDPRVSGIVHVAAFGCGPDSLTGELIERRARAAGVPFLNLNIDEHTAETGVLTRLEAFLDMVRWKKNVLAFGGV